MEYPVYFCLFVCFEILHVIVYKMAIHHILYLISMVLELLIFLQFFFFFFDKLMI